MTTNAPQPSNETEHEQPTEMETFYLFTAAGDKVCPECQALHDTHAFHSPPVRPHMNCKCDIEQRDIPVKKVRCSSQITDTFEHIEEVGNIPPGGSLSDNVNRSESTTPGYFSPSVSGGGGSISYTPENTSTRDGTGTTTNFNYDEAVAGDNQLVVAVYRMDEITETCVWETDTTVIGDGIPPGLEFETTAIKYSQPMFERYKQIGF